MEREFPERILLIDEEPDIAAVLKRRLESAGYDVHAEYSGRRALRYAGEILPDLVIMDVRFHDVDGYRMCQRLRHLYRALDVPLMIYTFMDEPIDEELGYACGADAYLTKQHAFSELLHTTRQLIHGLN